MEFAKVVKALRSSMGEPVLGALPRDPFKILIATIISQRTKDETTDIVSRRLFSKYPNAKSLSGAPVREIERLIKPAGFYKTKAGRIKEVSKLVSSGVPDTLEGLTALPGVGRKTANCVLVYAYGTPAIPVDIHVHVVSNRLGWVKTKTPDETEAALSKILPKKYWGGINSLFVRLGQLYCRTQKPLCQACPINKYCAHHKRLNSPQ